MNCMESIWEQFEMMVKSQPGISTKPECITSAKYEARTIKKAFFVFGCTRLATKTFSYEFPINGVRQTRVVLYTQTTPADTSNIQRTKPNNILHVLQTFQTLCRLTLSSISTHRFLETENQFVNIFRAFSLTNCLSKLLLLTIT